MGNHTNDCRVCGCDLRMGLGACACSPKGPPHYNELAAELLRLRTENATLKAECGAWRAWCEWGIHVTAGENDDVDDTTARHWKDVEAARTATNQLCPEWAKENP